jgi:hypothetical protein
VSNSTQNDAEALFREWVRAHVGKLTEVELAEFCAVGGGNIMGYNTGLGVDPDDVGRQKNKPPGKKKRKKV